MPINNVHQSSFADKNNQPDDAARMIKLLRRITSNWYYIAISVILALIIAFLYNRFAVPVYRVSSSILMNEERRGISTETNQIFQGFGLGMGLTNLDNQIMLLTSRTLTEKTLEELLFEVEFYKKILLKKKVFYPESIIEVYPENPDSIPRDIKFSVKIIDNNFYKIKAVSGDTLKLNSRNRFGDKINISGYSFSILLDSVSWQNERKIGKIDFICHSKEKLTDSYLKRLKVEAASKNSTVVNVSLESTNKMKDIDFINKLIDIFIANSLDKKNEEALRTIAFIDDQLIGISDSLIITENRLQDFRSRNRVMNLSSQGQAIIEQAMNLENEKARIEIEANYYNYLADYLIKDKVGEVPIAPATIGITDPGLTRLVAELADLQSQLYSKSLGEKNPLRNQLLIRVRNTKEALKETLNGVRRANNLAREENLTQIRNINSQATALPMTERQLLGIERKFKLNDELYTFLLERRAVAQIQKASNLPDNELIDTAKSDIIPIKPKKAYVYLFALVAGLTIPLVWITLADVFNFKVKDLEDISAITDIPVTGLIPHSLNKSKNLVLESESSLVGEAFRSLRSKMQFLTKDTRTPVIMVSSSISDEGKTFTTINLASVYCLTGKKTVIVGCDLRKPNLSADFDIENEIGISTWLIGKDSLNDIIKQTPYSNLYIIPSGPVPPNPSELISLPKTAELINLLKEKFDCIIIDSSPVGTVSDAVHLIPQVDTVLLVVRQNRTPKSLLVNTLTELKFSDIKNISIVFNDITKKYNYYGYGNISKYGTNKF